MARIPGVPREKAGPMVKLVYIFMGRGMKKMTGRAPARGSGIEPVEIWAYQPKMLSGMGKFQQAVRKGHSVDERLKNLIELKDVDGKAFVKERVELGVSKGTFWQDYKFMNPVSKKIEPKQMYCEKLDDTVVCGGVYKN